MSDIYIASPDRIILGSPIGDIQAWPAPSAETSVAMSFYADMKHARSASAYIGQTLNLSAADARELAAALIAAADHADKVRTDKPAVPVLGDAA